jgi:hypothetical protein
MRLADKRLGFELKLKKVLTFNYCVWIEVSEKSIDIYLFIKFELK